MSGYNNRESTKIRTFIHGRFIEENDPKCSVERKLYDEYSVYIWTDVGITTNSNIGIPIENNTVLE